MIPGQREQRIYKLRRTIHYIAYGSLVLDICITVLTLLSLFQSFNPEGILVPVNYLLTVVVVISLVAGVMVIYMEHAEKLFEKSVMLRAHLTYGFS